MIVIDNKPKLIARLCLGIVFITLFTSEIFESLLYGLVNAMDYDVVVLSIIGLLLTIFALKFSRLMISFILGYFIWKLLTAHFPGYPAYQAFTHLLKLVGISSLEAQKGIHILIYSSLIIVLYFSKRKK